MLRDVFRVVFVTCSGKEEAEKISKTLVKEKLAACVNVVSTVKSFFWWEGKVDESEEHLLIIKTSVEKMEKLIEKVKELHSYSVPEIISLPILEGNKEYLKWIEDSLK
nr:divalent-cation tolerance protein CutA [Candidatus Baldrarchaeota archaeon]